jgi:hypothetical protein
MSDDLIKLELARLITEAEALEVKLVKHHTAFARWSSRNDSAITPDDLFDEADELNMPFEYLAKSIYLATVCLLDHKRLHVYLNHFYQRFGAKSFDSRQATSEFTIDLDEPWNSYNCFLRDIRQFLEPLNVLQDKSRYLRLLGIQYLETILRGTGRLVHDSGKTPISEPQVYGIVRPFIQAVFPSAIGAKSNFLKIAKSYNPDILVPELFAAIEYKYATDENKLKTAIGQIADDAKGYTGDRDYKLFYAVFYVTSDFWGQERFTHAWNDMKFPENWKSFYVVGK